MAAGELHVGVCSSDMNLPGPTRKDPGLKPLALSVNVYRYPTAYIRRGQRQCRDPISPGLKGQTLAIAGDSHAFLRLYIDRESRMAGKKPEEFFSRIAASENVEDALDDAVDGVVQAVVVHRAGLEAYKKAKTRPFQATQTSGPVRAVPAPRSSPSTTISWTSERCNASARACWTRTKKKRGQTLLNLFHLTKFESVPKDFDRVRSEMGEELSTSGGRR